MVTDKRQNALLRALALVRGIRADHNPYMQPKFARTYERLVVRITHETTGTLLRSEVESATTEGHRVLEVGAGTGSDALTLAQSRPDLEVIGSEPHGPMLDRAKALADQPRNLSWIQAAAEELPFDDGSFNAVYSANAIKHFPDPRDAVAEMLRVLRPGGLLLVTEISPWVPFASTLRFVKHAPIPFPLKPVLAVRVRRGTARLLPPQADVHDWFRDHEDTDVFTGLDHAEHPEHGPRAFWVARLRRSDQNV